VVASGWDIIGTCDAFTEAVVAPARAAMNRWVFRRDGLVRHPPATSGTIGAVVADIHDEWQSADSRRYLSETSMALLYPTAVLDPSPRSNRGD
jgi:hypothetical protein